MVLGPYKCKEFNKYGTVRLPCKWRNKLDFTPGSLVDLVLKNDTIVIKKHTADTTENTRVVSEEGTISIPAEFKNLMDLTPDDEICIYIDEANECFIVKQM